MLLFIVIVFFTHFLFSQSNLHYFCTLGRESAIQGWTREVGECFCTSGSGFFISKPRITFFLLVWPETSFFWVVYLANRSAKSSTTHLIHYFISSIFHSFLLLFDISSLLQICPLSHWNLPWQGSPRKLLQVAHISDRNSPMVARWKRIDRALCHWRSSLLLFFPPLSSILRWHWTPHPYLTSASTTSLHTLVGASSKGKEKTPSLLDEEDRAIAHLRSVLSDNDMESFRYSSTSALAKSVFFDLRKVRVFY